MGFERILGQPAATQTLARALEGGKVHHGYRFEGPNGVGKEMAAFAFAQALVCSTKPPEGHAYHACGKCSACTRALAISAEPPRVPLHPDIVIIERGLYPPEALRRARPELQDISVDQIRRLVLERASYPPHEGRAHVFIVRRAHELSLSASNALLKTLEEPIANTYFLLLTDRGNELLTTIRSRTQMVRFGPLADKLVQSILEARGVPPDAAELAAELAGGSVAAALELADPEATRERRGFVEAALGASHAPDLAPALALSDARARDKEVLRNRLTALSAHFARVGRNVAGDDLGAAVRAAKGHEAVVRAIDELERNGSPALVLEAMVARLRQEV
jgi:DNA polymerase-3 subunit delta'